jgi:methyl-accepting chemotaxis protein
LIETTVKKVHDGTAVATQAYREFAGVTDSILKAAEMVEEIAHASEEQARGAEQINKAVADMDRVTQKNAADAEESASVCEELGAKAKTMRQLVSLVGGANGITIEALSPVKKGGEKNTEALPGGLLALPGKSASHTNGRSDRALEYHRKEPDGAMEHESMF